MQITLSDRLVRTIRIAECTTGCTGTAGYSAPRSCTVEDLLRYLEINPLTVIVSRAGKLIPEDSLLKEEDEIGIITVSHGG